PMGFKNTNLKNGLAKSILINLRTLCPLAKEFNSVCGIWGIPGNVSEGTMLCLRKGTAICM
ncbi:MAG: hypothetical protein ABIN97_04265, partial [Ginsengibacter sp.]